jgi:hypothetical protein
MGTNKKFSAAPLSFSSSAGEFSAVKSGDLLDFDPASEPQPESYIGYMVLEDSGTYDFTAISSFLPMWSFGVLSVFRGDGPIELVAKDARSWRNTPRGAESSVECELDWAESAGVGVVLVGAGSSLHGGLSCDMTSSFSCNGDVPRRTVAYEILGENANTSRRVIWTDSNIYKDRSGSGSALVLAFSEISSEPKFTMEVESIHLAEGSLTPPVEPGDAFELVVISVNRGPGAANNIRNCLKVDPEVFNAVPVTSDLYESLLPGRSTSTVYRVEVLREAGGGAYSFNAENTAE